MLAYLLQGMVLGFAGGISPGPLLGLVINQTLRRGWRAGNMVALAPLLSDTPIIVLSVVVLGHLPLLVLHLLSLLGGTFVVYLGIETLRSRSTEVAVETQVRSGRIVLLAVGTNLLNPNPYLFWATVGGTLLLQSFATGGIADSSAFVIGLYALLVGTKLGMAFLVSHSQRWLKGNTYYTLLIGSGLLLIGLGLLLIWEGIQYLA
jgi:threonine/homoserine/homoserine lactone efflux protein